MFEFVVKATIYVILYLSLISQTIENFISS